MTDSLVTRVIELVQTQGGVKDADLVKHLSFVFDLYNQPTALSVLSELVKSGDVVKVEYVLPEDYGTRAFYLPKGTRVYIVGEGHEESEGVGPSYSTDAGQEDIPSCGAV